MTKKILIEVPKDCYAEILKVQSEHKTKHNIAKYSLASAVVKIIKERIKLNGDIAISGDVKLPTKFY